ncbi:hypothetical protein VHEMI04246 [[Torrubiella] hemipterigena]|uniref:Xylanolytic transcriptional activator regulatory domain-containing protein n=1 Tax=[Torrubiella] hemipterigena TaxID=1531966 RepID=A0A0A1TD99_9HYPO|nr:hypothetical protein VHEMI04246 [[Torrubiella] hemipterigena]
MDVINAFHLGGMFLPGAGNDFYAANLQQTLEQDTIPNAISSPPQPLNQNTNGMPTPDESSPGVPASGLPPIYQMVELTEIFFEKLYPSLPILHKPTILSKLKSGGVDAVPQVLLLAIATASARFHRDQKLRDLGDDWFKDCRSKLTDVMRAADHGLETLQAAMIITLESAVRLDFASAVMLLAETWRKAVALGYNQVDGKRKVKLFALGGTSSELGWIEAEEARRVVWSILIIDRGLCFPIGLLHVLDDKVLVLDFPMSDEIFQEEDTTEMTAPKVEAVRYCKDFDKLITAVQSYSRKSTPIVYHYIILAYVLMGRISEELYAPEFDYETCSHSLDKLAEHLVRIRLILPRSCSDLAVADQADLGNIVWLHAILNSDAIMIHHRPKAATQNPDEPSEHDSNWPHCRAAGRNTIKLVREATKSSSDFLYNTQICTPIFFSFLTTLLDYMDPSPSDATPAKAKPIKYDLEMFINIMTRQREIFPGIGIKYCGGARFYLSKDAEYLIAGKATGMREFLGTCDQWTTQFSDDELVIPDRPHLQATDTK